MHAHVLGALNNDKSVKPSATKGLNRLTGKRTYRVVAFLNGKYTESHEVIYDKPSQYTRPVSMVLI